MEVGKLRRFLVLYAGECGRRECECPCRRHYLPNRYEEDGQTPTIVFQGKFHRACESPMEEESLIRHEDELDDAVDYRGRPAVRSTSGRWRSAGFIIGVEVAERFAYYGISSNLITYLTDQLGQSTATAAESVNAWSGTSFLLPLLGAFVADSFLGRYRTILFSSALYVLGLGMLTLSATIASPTGFGCKDNKLDSLATLCYSSTQLHIALFFFSLYLVAFAQGGHKPCVQAFGADQFDGNDPEESKSKSSFFNWWYFCLCVGTFATINLLNYVEENLGWVLGFGIPSIAMSVAMLVFVLGTRTYRYSFSVDEQNPFARIGRVFVAAARNWRTTSSALNNEEEARGNLPHKSSQQFRFLDKALVSPQGTKGDGRICTIDEVEEAKEFLRLVPIWATCLLYAVVFAQSSTFFTKQGVTMDRSITPGWKIPAASLQSFITLTIILTLPLYDRMFVPIMRSLTGKPSGITMLQRIGIGMFFSAISMVIAALAEIKRLDTADKYGLVDTPNATIPLTVCWLIPQYVLFGVADVFTIVGLQEFFYDQVPNGLRSLGLALYLSILGVGSFLSSFLVSAIEDLTSGPGHEGWFANNLNRAHLDYFYWLLAGLSVLELGGYLYFTKLYTYKKHA